MRSPFTVPAALVTAAIAITAISIGVVLPPGKAPGTRLELVMGNAGESPTTQVVQDTIESIRRRLRQLDASDAAVSPSAMPDRLTVEDRSAGLTPAWPVVLTTEARLGLSLVEAGPDATRETLIDKYGGALPHELMMVSGAADNNQTVYYVVSREPAISGRHIATAKPARDELNLPAVAIRLSPEGVTRIHALTRTNVGRAIAILLNDRVQSAPVIEAPINQADVRITGTFTQDEVTDLALLLRAGPMPASLTITDRQELAAVSGYPIVRWLCLIAGVLLSVVSLLFLFGYLSDRSTAPAAP